MLDSSLLHKAGFRGLAIAFSAAVALTSCDWWAGKQEPAKLPPNSVEALEAEEVDTLSSLSAELDELQREVKGKNDEISEKLREYQIKGGQLPPNIGADLTEEQRQLLAQKIKEERASLGNLLQETLEKDRDIGDLKYRIAELQSRLPDFVTANEGDRHDRLAMNFLVKEKGLSEKQAWNLVSKVNLQQPLLPGYRVWTYYKNDNFGTWVTQGTSSISPQEIQERIRRKLESERDAAVTKTASLEGHVADLRMDVNFLEKKRNELKEHVSALAAEEAAILAQLSQVKASLAQAENTTRYLIGSNKQLKKSGVISSSLLGGMRLKSLEGFEMLVLGQSTELVIDGSVYGLSRIKKVSLLPKVFQKGTDYEVYQLGEGEFAKVELLNPEKFRQFKFVVVLE